MACFSDPQEFNYLSHLHISRYLIIIFQQDRVFAALVSLIAMAMLVSVSPVVKEIAVAMGRGEKRGNSSLHKIS